MGESRYRGLAYETARLQLARIRVEGQKSRSQAYQTLVRVSAEALAVDQAHVFSLIEDGSVLSSECLFDVRTRTFSKSLELESSENLGLMNSLKTRRVALFDRPPALEGLGSFYEHLLRPEGVAVALCAPVIRDGAVVGFLSFQWRDPAVKVTQEQLGFAGSVADLTALILEQAERAELQAALHFNAELHHENAKMVALSRLARLFAHDINGLLTVVSAAATELTKSNDGPFRELSADLRQVVDLGRRLTGSLLTFGSDAPPLPEVVDLREVSENMLPMFRSLFSSTQRLSLDVQTDRTKIIVDRLSVEQVLLNLVKNAQEALRDSGHVVVRIREPGPHDVLRVGATILEVEDDGEGMDPRVQAQAAEPYNTTKGPGHAIGQTSVFGVAQRYNGGVRLTSEPGKGTRVAVAFERG